MLEVLGEVQAPRRRNNSRGLTNNDGGTKQRLKKATFRSGHRLVRGTLNQPEDGLPVLAMHSLIIVSKYVSAESMTRKPRILIPIVQQK